MVIVTSLFVQRNVYTTQKLVIVIKIFYFQFMVINVEKKFYFSISGFLSPWRLVVLLSELSKCVQQDCTRDEGDAMVYCIEA